MFYHGIHREYVYQQFPILSPRRCISHKDERQLSDRRHLIRKFGLEPIHLLESSENYPDDDCIQACFSFGDTVFGFPALEDPLWQLSTHEIGVTVLDLRASTIVYTSKPDTVRLKMLLPGVSIRYLEKFGE